MTETAPAADSSAPAVSQIDQVKDLLIAPAKETLSAIKDDAPEETIDYSTTELELDAAPADETPTAVDDLPQDQAPADDAEPVPVTSFKELAKQAKINMKDLYSLTVGFGDGTDPMTLGEMKDHIKASLDMSVREDELATGKESLQNEIMKTRSELEHAISLAQVTPEMMQQGAAAFEALLAREQTALRNAIPEMADPEFRKTAHDQVTALAEQYGISGQEVNNLADHRVYKLAMDFAALRKRVTDANARLKKGRKGTQVGTGNGQRRPTGNDAQGAIDVAMKTGLVPDQINATAAILGAIK